MNLSPRAPGKRELLKALLRAMVDRKAQRGEGMGLVLDAHMPVIYAGRMPDATLAIAPAARSCRRAVILIFFTWSGETERMVRGIRRAAIAHRWANPGHTLIFLCNSAREAELLKAQGEIATLLNHNAFVSEHIFRPLEQQTSLYDAIYNARLSPFKRHELTLDLESCAFIHYQSPDETDASDAAVRKRHAGRAKHVFVNPLVDGKAAHLPPEEVNRIYNQSAVGLCLSACEGAMFASMEYMLAGLPIVSTPSLGGRDVYFDNDYCIITRPDPRGIRDAVAALKARAIPRAFIAGRTREKVGRDRARLETLLDQLRIRDGRDLPSRDTLFGPGTRVEWRSWSEFLGRLAPTAFE